jgi:hypothetical protein
MTLNSAWAIEFLEKRSVFSSDISIFEGTKKRFLGTFRDSIFWFVDGGFDEHNSLMTNFERIWEKQIIEYFVFAFF